ncbi:MurR/RpiR family transcriptional regulator [Pelagimonas varians]|uniref:Putative HTH-type transcriptional regulator YbbH n=1 Tax=Pelagimonas varians TaxID=696760 RepID=A0A238KA15_9RHOB|nr:MurR/RpiR family transcriptional regulator [Pelagimonas varians]PYG31152.1 RpiR family transcriptional regulator [Pelagimonas varians]SMX39740.1 putative HTH-type transcriptional regulator YbbH [Pelagimonas varians]
MDPTLKNKTISALKDGYSSMPPRLQRVAKYVLDQPSDFGLDSIRETARKCEVSTYTLVRMAKTLGFDGFEDLRTPFRQALVASSPMDAQPEWIDALRSKGQIGEVLADAGTNAIGLVHKSLERQTLEKMERVADLLLSAPNVYLTAVRASYAMAYYFHYVGRMALPSLQLIPRHMNSAVDELNTASDGDVMIAITFSPYSRETIEACKFARARGVKVILISDSDVVSTEFTAEETLIASVISTHHFGCYAGVMAILENLLALLVRLGGDAAKTRIKSYEDLRKDNNAYWTANKKH